MDEVEVLGICKRVEGEFGALTQLLHVCVSTWLVLAGCQRLRRVYFGGMLRVPAAG